MKIKVMQPKNYILLRVNERHNFSPNVIDLPNVGSYRIEETTHKYSETLFKRFIWFMVGVLLGAIGIMVIFV